MRPQDIACLSSVLLCAASCVSGCSRAPEPASHAAADVAAAPFDESLELLGISFRVSSPNRVTGNALAIAPAGLENDNSPIERPIGGVVRGAEVADLDVDGSPEIYVYVVGAGAEARGELVAFSANRKKSLSVIALPELSAAASDGYRGRDEFAVLENVLGRRFPIFGKDGNPAAPTGRMRQLQYKLEPGEAGWLLRLDRTTEF